MYRNLAITAIAVAILAAYIRPIIQLSGLFETVHPFGLEYCVKLEGPLDFRNCEDFVLSSTETGVAYASCDPARDFVNSVMGTKVKNLNDSAVENGQIWRVNYTSEPPEVTPMHIVSGPDCFHPLGLAIDDSLGKLLVINRVYDGPASIMVFHIDQQNQQLNYEKTIRHAQLYSPNSIHILKDPKYRNEDGTPSFFFTNDHYFVSADLKSLETLSLIPLSSVMFYDIRTDMAYPVARGLVFANGLTGNDSVLFVSESNRMAAHVYKIHLPNAAPVRLEHTAKINVGMATDNLHYDASSDRLLIAGHPKPLQLLSYVRKKTVYQVKPPSRVVSWHTTSDIVETLFEDNGSTFSTSATAAVDPSAQKLLISGLYEKGMMLCNYNGV